MVKRCSNPNCSEINPQSLDNYYTRNENRRGGLETRCKTCIRSKTKKWANDNEEHVKEYKKRERELPENKEKAKEYNKEYREKNREELNQQNREYYEKNKDSYKKKSQEYRIKNREVLNAQQRQKRKEDPIFKITNNIRKSIQSYTRIKNFEKTSHFNDYIGCTPLEFRSHIESLFQPGMTWENCGKGKGKWNLDHNIPLDTAQTIEELYRLNHYSNIRPLWSEYNNLKSNMLPNEWEVYKILNNINESIIPSEDILRSKKKRPIRK